MHKLNLFFTIALFYFTNIACAQKDKEYDAIADSLSVKGKFEEAISFYTKAIQINAKDDMYFRGRALMYLYLQKFAESEKDYQQALQINPKCARCYGRLALIEIEKKNLTLALILVENGLKIDEKEPFLYLVRGQISMEQDIRGKSSAILEDFDKSIKLDSTQIDGYFYRGNYYNMVGYSTLAYQDFSKVIALDSNNVAAYYERANIYVNNTQNKDLAKAINDLNKCISLRPDYSHYAMRGYAYSRMEKYKEALVDFDKCISMKPDYMYVYYHRAKTKFYMEDMEGSCKDNKQAFSMIDKSKPENQELLTEIKESLEENCNPNKLSYYYHRGIAAYNLRKFNEAIIFYNQGLQKYPNNTHLLGFKGNALLELQKYQEAIQCYITAIANVSNSGSFLKENIRFRDFSEKELDAYVNNLISENYYKIAKAKCLMQIPDIEGAFTAINTAIGIGEKNIGKQYQEFLGEEYNLRGVIYLEKGEFDKAKSDFDKSIGLSPYYAKSYTNRAATYLQSAIMKRVRQSNISLQTNFANTDFGFKLPAKEKIVVHQESFKKALEDCNIAISLEPDHAYSYYVRGHIKLYLEIPDFCADLLKAKELGFFQAEEIINQNCK